MRHASTIDSLGFHSHTTQHGPHSIELLVRVADEHQVDPAQQYFPHDEDGNGSGGARRHFLMTTGRAGSSLSEEESESWWGRRFPVNKHYEALGTWIKTDTRRRKPTYPRLTPLARILVPGWRTKCAPKHPQGRHTVPSPWQTRKMPLPSSQDLRDR